MMSFRSVVAASLIAMLLAPAPAMAESPKREMAEKSADNGEKMVCKRFAVTGSLVQSYRTCKTKHEWERERENLRILGVSDSCRMRAEGGSCQ